MFVFATSDKGGTGRSVTAANLAYRHALAGGDCCYLDFDFGSPTAGAIFQLPDVPVGAADGNGLHSHVVHGGPLPTAIDVWTASERPELRRRPSGAGRLVLIPGDEGGGEFRSDERMVQRCADMLLRANEQYDLVIIDLSAGRSFAVEIALEATADRRLTGMDIRWLVFHRWTYQHIVAAHGLVYGKDGILGTGERLGHDPANLRQAVRFVRTTAAAPDDLRLSTAQLAWLEMCESRLKRLAEHKGLGSPMRIADIPLDPVLQWQEQLLTDDDVRLHRTANQRTVTAFENLAKRLRQRDDDDRL
ncbi:hypothetical protein L083_4799 [Actinoplanes sp. N902-109]|nr:SCO2523 family variant P-loop protein [Actinoplanes sp. N902-109]AGL18309.1 hypothetical protein L083_4799 [Actinoplanes sp. N902-109]